MKKIFVLATFIFALILSTTAFAKYPGAIATGNFGALFIGTDDDGNGWYIDAANTETISNDGGELIFKSNFLIMYSDSERVKNVKELRDSGENVPDNLKYAMLGLRFKESGDKRYCGCTEIYFIDSNYNRIEGVGFTAQDIEWEEINGDTSMEDLFNQAKKYIDD